MDLKTLEACVSRGLGGSWLVLVMCDTIKRQTGSALGEYRSRTLTFATRAQAREAASNLRVMNQRGVDEFFGKS